MNRFDMVGTQLINGFVQAAMTNVLGFFGGHALGISQAWVIVPAFVISLVAAFSETNFREPANPAHLFLLMLAATVPIVMFGFAKPRSFLYLAPIVAAVLTQFLDRQARNRNPGVAMLLVSLILASPVGAIANLKYGTRPFKRNAVIPYQIIVDFIQTNEKGRVLVLSTDPVIPWVLEHRYEGRDRCVSFFFNVASCPASDQRYDSIFVIAGHSHLSENVSFMREFNSALNKLTAGRQKIATIHAGVDEDAELKSGLTAVRLDKYILTVDLY
jgi:hypothetical protein